MGPARAPDTAGQGRGALLAPFGFEALEGDPELAAITAFTRQLCAAPSALISIVETDRQRFIGRARFDDPEPAVELSFCAHAMRGISVMEVRDAAQDVRFGDNELVTGPMHLRFYAGVPLRSPEGTPLGALCVIDTEPRPDGLSETQRMGLEVLAAAVVRRLTARRAGNTASAQAAEGARAMREIADQLPVIVWAADSAGRFDFFNAQWARVTGHPNPKETEDWRAVVHPDDAATAFGAWERSFTQGEPFESEYRLRQYDGSWRWTLSRALPLKGRDGNVVRWFGTLTDVDTGHREIESRDLLARELSHRIKNIFAVIAGLVSLRSRRRPELREFAEELSSSIRALGRAHDFVRPLEGATKNSLTALLTELMAPYALSENRISITGADCPIGPRAATPLALVFHELATNAAKYGALSVEGGRVAIAVDCENGDGMTRVTWREQGGPAVGQPATDGFGTRLLAMAIEGQLAGRFERRYLTTGLEIDITIPDEAIAS